jgi:hypothetical protein
MLIVTLKQAQDLAGIYRDDPDMVQDLKLQAWIAGRKYRVIEAVEETWNQVSTQARDEGVTLIITKEKSNGKQS